MSQEVLLVIIEYLAVGLNILYILLAAKEKRSGWIYGGIASLISVYLFYQMRLVSESFLYFFYFIMAVIGYIQWGNTEKAKKPILILKIKQHLFILSIGLVMTFGFYHLAKYTQRADLISLDALTTSFSILATWMTVKKYLNSWIYWVVIDIISVYMYYIKGLEIYSLQMIVFTILAFLAYLEWRKSTSQTQLNES